MTDLRTTLLLAAAAAALLPALSACGSDPVAAAPATTPATTAAAPTPPASAVLGPTGYHHLRIGMGYADALATGDLTAGSGADKASLHLTGHPDAGTCVSKKDGVMAIFAGKDMHTPEGIKIGSTARQLQAAYPGVRSIGPDGSLETAGIMRAEAGHGDWYEIDVNRQHLVTTIILRQDHQTCFE